MSNTHQFQNNQELDTKQLIDITTQSQPLTDSNLNMKNYSQSQIEIPQSNLITLTLQIKEEFHVIEQSKITKYNDFLKLIKKNYFPELNNENQLIVTQGWHPINPKQNDFTLGEAVFYFGHRFQVRKLYEFLWEMVAQLLQTQDNNKRLSEEINSLQKDIEKDQKQGQKDKYQALEIKYNKLGEKYKLLEDSFQKFTLKIDQNKIIKENSSLIKSINQFTCKLREENIEVAEQQQKLGNLLKQKEQTIQKQIQQLKSLQEEKLELEKIVTQLEKQQLQIDKQIFNSSAQQMNQQVESERLYSEQQQQENFKQNKQCSIEIKETNSYFTQESRQSLTQRDISSQQGLFEQEQQQQQQEKKQFNNIQYNYPQSEQLSSQKKYSIIKIKNPQNNYQKQECINQMISITSIDMTKLNQVQSNQYDQRQFNQLNSQLITQLTKCSYCNLPCSEFIQLPCLHTYHIVCLEQIGRNSYENQNPQAKCICSKIISIRCFTKNTQTILLQLQAAQIFKKYQQFYKLRKCNDDCEFYYINKQNTNQNHYCPNCQKYMNQKYN